jgi:DNA-directed RNA polymerase subunit RPC12/RpoP
LPRNDSQFEYAVSIEFKCACQSCGNHIAFAEDAAGQEITCPHCGKPVTLGLNLVNVPVAAMSEEQQTPQSPEPYPFFNVIGFILILAVIVLVIVALAKFVLFWAFQ